MNEQKLKIVIVESQAGHRRRQGPAAAMNMRRLFCGERRVCIFCQLRNALSHWRRDTGSQQAPRCDKRTSGNCRFRLDVRTRSEAIRIDRTAKQIVVKRLADGSQMVQPYDKLILSPGAAPLSRRWTERMRAGWRCATSPTWIAFGRRSIRLRRPTEKRS